MLNKIKNAQFVVFDCETTGLDWTRGNQIIELAGQKTQDGKVIEEFHHLINPTVLIEDGAYKVHGLSNLFLSENGGVAEELLPSFVSFVGDAILVGHNILTFDLPFLNAELSRVGQQPMRNMLIDTLVMARKVLPHLPNHKLTTVAGHYKLDSSGAHRALFDVEMNRIVFYNMLGEYMAELEREEAKRKAVKTGKLF